MFLYTILISVRRTESLVIFSNIFILHFWSMLLENFIWNQFQIYFSFQISSSNYSKLQTIGSLSWISWTEKNVTKTFNKKNPKRSMHICVYRIKSLPFMVIIVPCGNICPIWYVSLPFNTFILFKALNFLAFKW